MMKFVQTKANRKSADKNRTKTDRIVKLLGKSKGASISELMRATGWQAHSIRGFMSGTLKRKGLAIQNEKTGDERRYRISVGQVAS